MKKNFIHLLKKLKWTALLSSLIFWISKSADAQPISQTFTSSGTYTVPAGWNALVSIEVWGAGGSGGGGNNGNGSRYGGGGGGYARLIVTLTPGTYTVTVGKGGIAPTNVDQGNNGGTSSFSTLVSASGGKGGSNNASGAGGNTFSGTGITTHNGGNGGARNSSNNGGGGGGGGSALAGANGSNGSNASGSTGGSGGAGQGAGGNGGNNNAIGLNGIAPGGGGGGKGDNGSHSGNGADGQVVINVTSQISLPVEFGNFKVSQKESGVQLDWTTYTEINVSHFEIEHSTDGINFSTIGQVGATNHTVQTDYSWFDAEPSSGNNLYRIKSVDLDGKVNYTAIVKINLGISFAGINIYPNPVTAHQISFQASDLQPGTYLICIYNSMGQQLFQQSLNHSGGAISQSIQLPASINAGMYNLVVINGNSKISKPFIVQ